MKLPYRIKKKQNNLPLYAMLSLLMLIMSAVCLFASFIPFFESTLSAFFLKMLMIIGGICTLFFAFSSSYIIFNIVSPPVGIIIKENGFYDYTMASGGVGFIPIEAILSLKLFGSKNKHFLGIKLHNEYLEQIGDTRYAKREIASNIESGMPAIIIRQSDICISVKKLLDVMLKVYGEDPATQSLPDPEHQPDAITTFSDEDTEPLESSPLFSTDDSFDLLTVDNNIDSGKMQTVVEDSFSPLTIDEDSKKDKIKTIDELLAKVLAKNGPTVDNEKQ